jgi:NTP pyrophosphatase (non-canonical NTP hydrolase)
MNNTPTAQAINQLVKAAHQNAINKDFWAASQNVGEKIALIHTEMHEFAEKLEKDGAPPEVITLVKKKLFEMGECLSKFLEGYRKDDLSPDEHCPMFTNQTIEFADFFIRLGDLAGWLHMYNLGEAIEAKMRYNETRPSLHGKKF